MGTEGENKTINRREFLKISVAGATTAAVGLSGLSSVLKAAEGQSQGAPPLAFRTLGRTGLKVTVVSFGAMLTPEHEVMRAAFDLGINYVDTARKYMGGRNEETVGRAIKGIRDRLFIATKVRSTSTSRKQVINDVETSLAKLGTDHIDVIQLHGLTSPGRAFIPEVREAFTELRTQGKVRFFGVTTHTNQAEVVNAVVDDKEKFFDTVLVGYNFKSSPDIGEAIARAAKAGIGVVAMKTQAGGYKTDMFGAVSPHQAALKWVLQNLNVTCAIPGIKDTEMLAEATSVMGMQLTRADERILEHYSNAISPYYCHLCGRCEPTCPNDVSISVINRSLMYAEGYRNMDLAQETYREVPKRQSALTCLNCGECVARCVHGIDIAQKMEKARSLFI
ncbi:MAG TPA: aldo/keto reductase [Syntrophorhabdaceae bacterium]|nr:aldo/keto reductase [Syntrophorhabdaceae bacterium]